jgi:hypothetical protein
MKRHSIDRRTVVMTVLVATLSTVVVAANEIQPLPQGFDEKPFGNKVAAARVDMPGSGETFEKMRQAHLQQWRVFVELAVQLKQPTPPQPVFAPGYDQPSNIQVSRFIKLDQTGDVRLATHLGYACKYAEPRPDPMQHGLICGPTVQRFVTLYKLIDGRVHRWEANLIDKTGTYSVSGRDAQQRLPRGDEGGVPFDQLGPRIGEAEHLGFRCQIRVVGEMKACYYLAQKGLPKALEDIAAWRQHDTEEKRYTRLGALVPNTELNAEYFEPPTGINYSGGANSGAGR